VSALLDLDCRLSKPRLGFRLPWERLDVPPPLLIEVIGNPSGLLVRCSLVSGAFSDRRHL